MTKLCLTATAFLPAKGSQGHKPQQNGAEGKTAEKTHLDLCDGEKMRLLTRGWAWAHSAKSAEWPLVTSGAAGSRSLLSHRGPWVTADPVLCV